MPLKYQSLSPELQQRILADRADHWDNPCRTRDEDVIRRDPHRDKANLWRPAFVRDVEKIMHSPFYNRYADKTQVFSFYRNDDISRRALHVQLVSRIARNIGAVLGLNQDLIEAIALGHDIGHTPFGHAGERFLSDLYQENTGRYFNHNVHSVRVLDQLFARNISLQTLNGILCHNGEFELKEYRPKQMNDFKELDRAVESCYSDKENIGALVPSTLEACVVRICDMVAYLGKDRQDARRARLIDDAASGAEREDPGDTENSRGNRKNPSGGLHFTPGTIGGENAEIINNLVVNILENSYGKDFLLLSGEHFKALKTAKKENYEMIYRNPRINDVYDNEIRPMFHDIYYRLLHDLLGRRKDSVIYRHHISFINDNRKYYGDLPPYEEEEPNQIVVDYIASMTDDYFIDLYNFLFPGGTHEINYVSYFDDMR